MADDEFFYVKNGPKMDIYFHALLTFRSKHTKTIQCLQRRMLFQFLSLKVIPFHQHNVHTSRELNIFESSICFYIIKTEPRRYKNISSQISVWKRLRKKNLKLTISIACITSSIACTNWKFPHTQQKSSR